MLVQVSVALLNVLMAVITLAVVAQFWWRHRREGLSPGWRIVLLAFGAFAVAQSLEFRRLLDSARSPDIASLEITLRFVFTSIFVLGLSRVLHDIIAAKQKALDDAERTIRIHAESVRQSQETDLLYAVSQSLVSTLNIEFVLKELCHATRELMGADSVSVRLPEPIMDGFIFADDSVAALNTVVDALDPRLDALCWKVVEAGSPTVIDDIQAHPLFKSQTPEWVRSFSAFPLRRGAETIGVLTVLYGAPQSLTPEQVRFISTLADQAAVAVHNAQLHDIAQQQAATDSLTGLANRRLFDEVLASEARRVRRYQTPAAIIVCDLDKFKEINDRFGHAAGDAYLQAFANSLRSQTRDTDTTARLGGDEFAVIMPNTSPADACNLAKRIKDTTAALDFAWGGQHIRVRTSMGIAGWEAGESMSPAEVLHAADQAMYADKTASHPIASA